MKRYDTNLSDLIHGRWHGHIEPLSIKTCYNLAIDIAKGMTALHSASIIHFDLKPANIVIEAQSEGMFKSAITDFGNSFY